MEDLKETDVKIGTKAEAMWTNVKKNMETAIAEAESEIIYSKEVLKLAEEMIEKEKSLA